LFMPKLKINEIPDEERLIFLKRIKKKELQGDFDYYADEIKKVSKEKGYEENEIKYITEGKFVNVYAIIKLEF
jgi:hypothetical protein